jgi:hypothetical protein
MLKILRINYKNIYNKSNNLFLLSPVKEMIFNIINLILNIIIIRE